jgi:LysM repeat protein
MGHLAPVRSDPAAVATRPGLSLVEGAGAARLLRVVESAPPRPTLVPDGSEPPVAAGAAAGAALGGGSVRSRAAAGERPRRSPVQAIGPGPARLTRRGRLVLAALATLVLAAVLTVVAPAVAHLGAPAAVPADAPAVVIVQPGDTLWSIARRIAPDRDARVVVADLRRLNSLPTAELEVGQRLQVRGG